MKITNKLLFLLCVTSVFASHGMDDEKTRSTRYKDYEKLLQGLQSVSSTKLWPSAFQNMQLNSNYYTETYKDSVYYTNIEKIIRGTDIDNLVLNDQKQTSVHIITIKDIENAVVYAQKRKEKYDKNLASERARKKASFSYYWKSYGSYIGTFMLGISSKILWDKYRR